MKKWIAVLALFVILVVLLAILYWYESRKIPLKEFKAIVGRFEPYVVTVDIQSEYEVHERLEFSVEEYRELQESLENEWHNVDFLVQDSQSRIDSQMFTEDERAGILKAYSRQSTKKVPLNMIKNICDELIIVIIHNDRVLAEYSAKMQVDQVPFFHLH